MVVIDLLSLAGVPAAVGAFETVAQQHVLDEEAVSDERQAEFYLDVFCDAKSSKTDQVDGSMVVLRDGKLRLWPKDNNTGLPKKINDDEDPPHPFTGFYYPWPEEELPARSSKTPTAPVLGLVSTIPPSPFARKNQKQHKPKLNWIYIDKETMEVKYGPRHIAKEHVIGSWDWTEDDEEGLVIQDKEIFVAVEEKTSNKGLYWGVYCDPKDNCLKDYEVGKKKRVLRCSLERRLVDEPAIEDL